MHKTNTQSYHVLLGYVANLLCAEGKQEDGLVMMLQAASMVVFAEYSWTPGTLVQAEDRVHRIGQANSVNVYYLHAKGSIDDIIWQTLEHKLDDVGQVPHVSLSSSVISS